MGTTDGKKNSNIDGTPICGWLTNDNFLLAGGDGGGGVEGWL